MLVELARSGHYPEKPLPTTRVDSQFAQVPFNYIRLSNQESTGLYTSLGDVVKGENPYRMIEPGFNFVSWIECSLQNGVAAYMIAPGVYVRGGGDCSRIATPGFLGLSFYRTPQRPFAWILAGTFASREPGIGQPQSTRWVNRYEVVQIFEERRVGNLDWYRIGPSDWIEQRLLAKVEPDERRPEGVEGDQWISVNLYEQTVTVYEAGRLVYATLTSTGLPGWWTQPGSFQVYSKLDQDDMAGAFEADRSDYYYLEDVPWVLYFDEARALHGAYWHNGFGYPRSHGCVNLSPGDAQWIFQWASEGTWVHVFDPSGNTPTDPSLYTAGGA